MDVERTPVTLRQYLQESGTGSFKKYRVPDLLPERGYEVEVLLVVESPHIDELRTGLPLSGDAGRRALTFLLPSGRLPEALGPYLAGLHTTNNPRMGILNVCPVPLQSGAFARHRMPPDLPQSDWETRCLLFTLTVESPRGGRVGTMKPGLAPPVSNTDQPRYPVWPEYAR